MLNALLAFGLVIATATQTRLPGIPLGIGEACLALWLGFILLRQLTGGRIFNQQALLQVGLFWVLLTLALSIGTCVALLSNFLHLSSMLHDAEAYLFMAAISCSIIMTMEDDRTLNQTLWLLLTFWNVALVLQIAAGWGVIALPAVDPWFWNRFRGWSQNPNQIALICAILTPLSLHLALSSKGLGRVAGLASCLLTLIVGRLTKSDTFLIAMVMVTALFLILRLRSWLSTLGLRFAIAVLAITAIIPLSLSLAPFITDVEQIALSLTKDRGSEATRATADLRLYLWGEALRTGLETGSLGLGPGPHLERPLGPKRAIPVPFETHSTILELFTQGGLLAVIAICGLFAGTFWMMLRARLDALAAMVATIAIYSFTHVVLRQPIIWFALALGLILGTQHISRGANIGSTGK